MTRFPSCRPKSSPAPRRSRGGFTLVETAISLAILGIGLVTLSSVMVQSTVLQRTTRDEVAAHNTCRDVMERFRNADLDTAFEHFSTVTQLDSESMRLLGSQASVQITYPKTILDAAVANAATDTQSRLPDVLTYQDEDADGYVDRVQDVGKKARLLPVRVVVRWMSPRGARQVTRTALVTQR